MLPLHGRAVEIKVRLGDQVRKDQDLVVVESPELGEAQADFLQKRTAAQSAGPQVDLAKAAWDRAKNLRAGNAEYVVPVKSTYTCSGRNLKFFSTYKDRGYLVSIGRVFTRA